MRQARFAGLFYPKGELSLKQKIKDSFEGPRGPGVTPPEKESLKKSRLPIAVISPHAGYDYSGECAAWSYKAIGEAPLADVYIIIGPNHNGLESGLTQEPFETPFGIVRVDQDFARRLLAKGNIKENNLIHEDEHSIEVQLPFLQFTHFGNLERIKILPIIIGSKSTINLRALAVDLKEVMMETNKKAVFIISSDFTHYGRQYHYIPFSQNIQENIAKLDKGAIDFIKKMDYEGLDDYANKNLMTICGLLPIELLLMTIKPEKVLLEQYYTSAEITGDEKNSVSYASMVFY